MRALIVVDVQNDFCPGGALAVNGGNEIVKGINEIMENYDVVVATQDWHPANHGSFASVRGFDPFSVGELNGLPQVFWPSHCVQDTNGAEFHPDLDVSYAKIIQKGQDENVDSYSAFYDNNQKNPTGLADYLREMNVDEVDIVGIATDYCVKATAIDAKNEGFRTSVLIDLCRGVDAKTSQEALLGMHLAGINIIGDVMKYIEPIKGTI